MFLRIEISILEHSAMRFVEDKIFGFKSSRAKKEKTIELFCISLYKYHIYSKHTAYYTAECSGGVG